MEWNSLQTVLDESKIDKEVLSELLEFYSTVKFIQNLTSKDRKYAKDLERDELGRIKVDLANPHILENTDYFRQSAIHYQKFNKYTNLFPNASPSSAYRKFWKEEARRCREGYIREYDGEWIPGPFYFYLNYSPILRNKIVPGTKRSERTKGFPDFYDGSYLYYHYKQQARDVGKHGGMLKRRGIGFSYTAASDLARILVLGDTAFNKGDIKAFAIASEKEYLVKDGILNKFDDNVNWCASNTPWPRLKSKDSLNNMVWEMGYTDLDGLTQGTKNSVIGVTTSGNPEHARGKRGPMYYDEWGLFPNLLKTWNVARESVEEGDYAHSQMMGGGCVCAGTKIWDNYGNLINIENITTKNGILGFNGQTISKELITYWQDPKNKPCYRITTNTGRYIECSEDHPILWSTQKYGTTPQILGRKFFKKTKFVETKNIKIGDQLAIIEEVPIFGNQQMWEPRLIGWLIGDGSYGIDHSPRLSNCEIEINTYVENNFNTKLTKSHITKNNKLYKEIVIKDICPILRTLGIYGQTKLNKTLPLNINTYSRETICELLGGLFDTDGCVEDRRISISSMSESLLNEIRFLLQKLSVHGRIQRKKFSKNNPKSKNDCFEFIISDKRSVLRFRDTIILWPNYKQQKLNTINKFFIDKEEKLSKNIKGLRFERVTKIENIGIKPVYNLTANNTNTYIANGIVTHNTGGTEGADFAGAEEMFYNADGYNILAVPNVFDKNTDGKVLCAFFFPAYLNRLGKYDKDGNSDVIGALIEILERRLKIKYNSTDSNTLVQHKAEMCITPQEAIMRREGSIFPIADLKDYVAEISPSINQFLSAHYIGHLKLNTGGDVSWDNLELHPPLRNYPLKDELDKTGCVEIFEMPHRMQDGTIPTWRYIAGIDPIDTDEGLYTTSLGSIFIFDTWFDRIVAEYTGRPALASDFYDTCLRLLKFYNAIANYENNIKGLFYYFDSNRVLHYLCDTPQVLKDMDQAKGVGFGNRAHPYSEFIYTPTGKKMWKDISIGDYVFGDDGIPTKVVDIPFNNYTDIYKIKLYDGREIFASKDHEWIVKRSVYNNLQKHTTKYLIDHYKRDRKMHGKIGISYDYSIPVNKLVEFEYKETPIDSYTLGLLLGDGTFSKSNTPHKRVQIASDPKDMSIYKQFIPYEVCNKKELDHFSIVIPDFKNKLLKLDLYDTKSITKFIPEVYKFNSKEVRLNLLRGLLDTDGYVRKEGMPVYCTISKKLADDVEFLVRSLGYNCKTTITKSAYKLNGKYTKCNDCYKILIWTNDQVFNLPRKLSKLKKSRKLKMREQYMTIVSVEYSHKELAKCITVNNNSNLYLINDFVVTSNSKGTTTNKMINAFGRKLQADWMISKAYASEEEKRDELGNLVEVSTKRNIHTIRSMGYLKEALAWNPDGNFDRISAMGMCMILRADRIKYEYNKYHDKIKTIYDDPWFKRFEPTRKITDFPKTVK